VSAVGDSRTSGAPELIEAAQAAQVTLASAESLTAGMICDELAAVPGASTVLRGGIVAYANDVKESLLGVSGALLAVEGSVHAEVARQMARGARAAVGATLGVATTGVAGPEAHDGQPVGTVFIGLADEYGQWSRRFEFAGTREEVRRQACQAALQELLAAVEATGRPRPSQ
jgi:nicotinamide-nucleotide amidase